MSGTGFETSQLGGVLMVLAGLWLGVGAVTAAFIGVMGPISEPEYAAIGIAYWVVAFVVAAGAYFSIRSGIRLARTGRLKKPAQS